jgi:RNA polymerase sigma-70 factor (ECF subfamily)
MPQSEHVLPREAHIAPPVSLADTDSPESLSGADVHVRDEERLRRIFTDQFAFIWRYLRRMGLSDADADDAAQQVFVVFARRLDVIEATKERAFLCGTAARVFSEFRRARMRRREVAGDESVELADRAQADSSLAPDDLADHKRARALLDLVLDQMEDKLRSVFVLFELEEMSTADIAEMLELPAGTVASRLRRARESFQAIVKRMRASGQLPGATP